MRTTYKPNYPAKAFIQENSLLHMEQFERQHIEQFYQSKSGELLCWGKEPTFNDSEFSIILEKVNQSISGY